VRGTFQTIDVDATTEDFERTLASTGVSA
jgi:hypothetical protein